MVDSWAEQPGFSFAAPWVRVFWYFGFDLWPQNWGPFSGPRIGTTKSIYLRAVLISGPENGPHFGTVFGAVLRFLGEGTVSQPAARPVPRRCLSWELQQCCCPWIACSCRCHVVLTPVRQFFVKVSNGCASWFFLTWGRWPLLVLLLLRVAPLCLLPCARSFNQGPPPAESQQ